MTPLALSISSEIKSLGAYAGFAAVVGLALLALLYFAQARELRRLTEWAGRAPERNAASGPPQAQARPPAPPFGQGLGSGPNVRPLGPARPHVPGVPGAPFMPQPPPGGPAAGAPGMGMAPGGAPGVGMPPGGPGLPPMPGAPGATAAAQTAAGAIQAPPRPNGPPPGQPATPGGPGFPPPPAGYGGGPGGYPPPPAGPGVPYPSATARVPSPPLDVPAVRAQPLAGPPALDRAVPPLPVRRPPPPPERRNGVESAGRGRSATRPPTRRTLAVVAGAFVVLVVLVFAATHLLGGSSSPARTGPPATSSTPGVSSAQSPSTSSTPAVVPSSVTVAVLNASSVSGLAARVGTRLQSAGYVKGYVGNAPPATGSSATSTVEYATTGDKPAAKAVAKALGLSSSAVGPLDAATAAVNSAVSNARVVVSVGSDLQQ
ncbi:MAG TPA: LytR C-terminal domain-containing protein [Solirubrobacteraceae bacterium]|jgi:hypothetical protein|nr:LytR C-terminal domain-containing protein [Solirubrobacteraceae bacterium]